MAVAALWPRRAMKIARAGEKGEAESEQWIESDQTTRLRRLGGMPLQIHWRLLFGNRVMVVRLETSGLPEERLLGVTSQPFLSPIVQDKSIIDERRRVVCYNEFRPRASRMKASRSPTEFLHFTARRDLNLEDISDILEGNDVFEVVGQEPHPEAEVLNVVVRKRFRTKRYWVVLIRNLKLDGTVYWLLRIFRPAAIVGWVESHDKDLVRVRVTARDQLERSGRGIGNIKWITDEEWRDIHCAVPRK